MLSVAHVFTSGHGRVPVGHRGSAVRLLLLLLLLPSWPLDLSPHKFVVPGMLLIPSMNGWDEQMNRVDHQTPQALHSRD